MYTFIKYRVQRRGERVGQFQSFRSSSSYIFGCPYALRFINELAAKEYFLVIVQIYCSSEMSLYFPIEES
jgi:hypothetical protein